jgi:hypothetical protein
VATGPNGTFTNAPYVISYDNPPSPTTLTVAGSTTGASTGDRVDIVCFYGSAPHFATLRSNLLVTNQSFSTGAVSLRPIAGHACRLRAVPAGSEGTIGETGSFSGPQIAVSEAALPSASIGSNAYNIYVNAVTFTGYAAWKAAGTNGCGPYAAPVDPAFDVGSFPIDCAGSLLGDDLGTWGGRSEVQIDGRNAYDAASAQALFPAANGNPPSQNLAGFPALTASVAWDPGTGLVSSTSDESWAMCAGPNQQHQTFATCPSFSDTGVKLERVITTSDGGRVVTMTDTWSSTDHVAHSLDLIYDDYAGVFGNATGQRGWQFPGQSGFSQYASGGSVPAPTAAPGSIVVRTNVGAADGDPNEGFGAITFGSAPAGFRFASNGELEERNLLSVPADGKTSLSYVYSVAYTLADVTGLALAAQDHFQSPALAIASPATGATVSNPTETLTGTTSAGSGIKSLIVGGQAVPVGPAGGWSATVPLTPGANTITALATDGAGATAQAQVTVNYSPPPSAPPPPPARCKVPHIKGMKLAAAGRALRGAHCRVGKVKRVRTPKVARGRVMSTTPRSGRLLPAGAKVELFISKGP